MRYVLSKFDESIKAQDLSNIDFPINGMFVVDVPDGVQIEAPVDYADLISQKLDGIVGLYSDFTDYVYDEFNNDGAIDYAPAAGDFRGQVAKYEIKIPGSGGRIYTTDRVLSYAPSQILVYWSVHRLTRSTNDLNGKDITFTADDESDINVAVSFDGGASYTNVSWATVETPASPTTNIRLRFSRAGAGDRYLGYYVVLYRA
jgi:hypothetical protein